MKFLHVPTLLGMSVLFCFGCASIYKPVNLKTLSYSGEADIKESVAASYMNNIQLVTKNKYYTKKEEKYGMVAVAVKVENRTSDTVELRSDKIKVLVNDTPKPFIMPTDYGKKVRQRVGLHMLHALWGPWALSWQTSNQGETDFKFIYIPVGAIVGIGNAIRASNANNANVVNLNRTMLWNQRIAPGETAYGTIIVPAQHSDKITLQFVE